jgi:hypothetical protein
MEYIKTTDLYRSSLRVLVILVTFVITIASCKDSVTDSTEMIDRDELMEVLENKLGPDMTLEDWGLTMEEFEEAYIFGQNQIKASSNRLIMQSVSGGPQIWESDYGTGLEIGDDDCKLAEIGFPFTFYGNTYTEVWVNSNGNMTFNDCNTRFWPTNIPDGTNEIIAPIYGDFVPEADNSDVYVNVTGTEPNRTFVATWLDITAWNWPGTNTFQVQLSETDQTIVFGYNGLTTNGINNINDRDMNVGISSGTGLFINSATREEIPELDMTNICYRPENGDYIELMGSCDALLITADAGENQTVECTGERTEVLLDGSGSTGSGGSTLSYEWWLDGEIIATGVSPAVNLPMGSHTIELTVSDANGGTASDEVTIDIVDTTPPELIYTIDATSVWPPNQKMVLAVSNITSVDLCDESPSLSVIITSSDSKINGNGRGNGPRGAEADENNNWSVVQNNDGTVDVYVRAVRYTKSGNIYTITLISEDSSGNRTEESIEVTVPHDAS